MSDASEELIPIPICYRALHLCDIDLVVKRWMAHIRKLHPFSEMSKEEFDDHKELLARLITRAPPIIACEPEHPEQAFGWICGEHVGKKAVLHFVYVRKTWRRLGLATQLMKITFPALGKETVYITHPSRSLSYHRDRWMLKFNPYMVAEHENQDHQTKRIGRWRHGVL